MKIGQETKLPQGKGFLDPSQTKGMSIVQEAENEDYTPKHKMMKQSSQITNMDKVSTMFLAESLNQSLDFTSQVSA